jgi:LacI family transcriptional regulator
MTAPTARLRIGDVAKLAGVSPATVSRVLSGSQTVSPESRERVLSVVSRFDYQPSRLARNLRQGRAEVVGVVVSDIENPHFASMVRAIEDALYRRGKRVLLCNTSEDAAKQASYLEVMAAERVLGIPVVAFDRTVSDPRADSVTAGNVEAARQAVRLLADRGHRRIGFVSGRAGVQTGDDRLAGYRAEARAARIEERVAGGEFSLEGGRAATAELLAARPRPTALLIANNQMSLGALELLRERGLAIPGDIAVVAFDDPPWANLIDPPLTALAQPLRQMADAAVDLLFERMAACRRQPAHLVFEFELRVRRSCGTAR